jgi:hypothetical protein
MNMEKNLSAVSKSALKAAHEFRIIPGDNRARPALNSRPDAAISSGERLDFL